MAKGHKGGFKVKGTSMEHHKKGRKGRRKGHGKRHKK